MNKYIAVTIGDINGIGMEILIKSWKKKQIKNFIIFTNIKIIKNYFKTKNIVKHLNTIDIKKKNYNYQSNKINIYSFNAKSLEDNTYKSLRFAYDFCKIKICSGIITLPLRKDLIKNKINKSFIGHTEYFQKIDNRKYSNMILFNKKIIVSPLTTHIKVKNISKIITRKDYLFKQILNLNNTLKIDFNIKRPKLIISGLNPHAGENGNIGSEEIRIIKPLITQLKQKGILIDGPFSADSILIKKNLKHYNCFIFIYHDQALIPFKFISQYSGVNYTGNLSIIRTSPDHGTAYDLVGSKNISNKSFLNCFKLIKYIYKNRIINDKS